MVAGDAAGPERSGGPDHGSPSSTSRRNGAHDHRAVAFSHGDDPGSGRFVVGGTLHGRTVTVAVSSPAEVIAEIAGWVAADPSATGFWGLAEDYSDPVTLVARDRPGLVPEGDRVAHVFPLVPGVRQGMVLTSSCGAEYLITDLEWLPLGAGMPCEGCLRLAVENPADNAGTLLEKRRIERIHPVVAAMTGHVLTA